MLIRIVGMIQAVKITFSTIRNLKKVPINKCTIGEIYGHPNRRYFDSIT